MALKQKPNKYGLIPMRMKASSGNLFPGDIAGFPPAAAEKLLAADAAEEFIEVADVKTEVQKDAGPKK